MFEQTFIDEPGQGIKPWAIAASFLFQALLLAAAILLPLLYTYDPPMAEWMRHTLLLAPPPPPAPPAPAAAAPKAPPPARFETTLTAPVAIPEKVSLLREANARALDGLQAPDLRGLRNGIPGGVVNGVLGAAAALQFRPPDRPVPVGGNVQAARIISKVSPLYPVDAVEQGISGVVHLEAIITKEGLIREIKVLSGDATLAGSALEAVRQWRYRPTYLNGNPVEVITEIEVVFHLSETPKEAPDARQKKKKKR